MKLIVEKKHASLYHDESAKIVMFAWNGTVPLDTLKNLVMTTAELVDNEECKYIMFDRRELESYTPDAKNWLKNDFMKNNGKRLINKIDKIGAVASKSTFARLVSTLLVGVLKFYNKNMQYKMFEEVDEALDWLKDKQPVS